MNVPCPLQSVHQRQKELRDDEMTRKQRRRHLWGIVPNAIDLLSPARSIPFIYWRGQLVVVGGDRYRSRWATHPLSWSRLRGTVVQRGKARAAALWSLFWSLWSFLVSSGLFWSPLVSTGLFWSFLVSSGLLWSFLVSSGLLWSFLVSSGLFWSPLVSSGLYWSLLVFSGLFWSLLVSSGLFWSFLVSSSLFRSLLVSSGLFWSLLVSVALRNVEPVSEWRGLCKQPEKWSVVHFKRPQPGGTRRPWELSSVRERRAASVNSVLIGGKGVRFFLCVCVCVSESVFVFIFGPAPCSDKR